MFIFGILFRLISIYSLVLVLYALLSWFPDAYQTTLGRWIVQLSEPVLKPLRRLPLQFGGIDFTVVVAIVLLNILAEVLLRLFYVFL